MTDRRPNIIYFNPDEMRADLLGCYGHPLAVTPNLDRLAAGGARFDQCHVQHTVCTPSRCSFMTGWYPHVRGHRTLWHPLQADEPNTLKYLKTAGYDVHWIGKNDLLAPEAFADSVTRVHDWSGTPMDVDLPGEGDPHEWSFLRPPMPHHPTDYHNMTRAIELLAGRSPDDPPLMLFLPFSLPHCPYWVPEPWYSMVDPTDVPPLRPAELAGKPALYQLIRQYRRLDRLDDAQLRNIMAVYLGMIAYVDHLVGRLMNALDETGLADSTLLMVFSDHGDWAGDYGLVEKWPNAFDDCLTRVPLLVRGPGVAAGHVVAEPVELQDICPTTLAAAGVDIAHTQFGRDLSDQLAGAAGDADRTVYTEGGYDLHEPHCFEGKASDGVCSDRRGIYYPKGAQQQRDPDSVCRGVCLRTADWKYIRRTNGEHEVYDLDADPRELTNLAGRAEVAEVEADLLRRLANWYLTTSDVTPFHADPRGFPREVLS